MRADRRSITQVYAVSATNCAATIRGVAGRAGQKPAVPAGRCGWSCCRQESSPLHRDPVGASGLRLLLRRRAAACRTPRTGADRRTRLRRFPYSWPGEGACCSAEGAPGLCARSGPDRFSPSASRMKCRSMTEQAADVDAARADRGRRFATLRAGVALGLTFLGGAVVDSHRTRACSVPLVRPGARGCVADDLAGMRVISGDDHQRVAHRPTVANSSAACTASDRPSRRSGRRDWRRA